MDNIFDICNHSLGMNINNNIINVKIEILKLKELDRANPESK
jgi:hypothetical protein